MNASVRTVSRVCWSILVAHPGTRRCDLCDRTARAVVTESLANDGEKVAQTTTICLVVVAFRPDRTGPQRLPTHPAARFGRARELS
jgi:hypothetical protein